MEFEEANLRCAESSQNYEMANKDVSDAAAACGGSRATLQEAHMLEKRQEKIANLAELEVRAAQGPAQMAADALSFAERNLAEAEAKEDETKRREQLQKDVYGKSATFREAAVKKEQEAKQTADDAKDKERKAFVDLNIADEQKRRTAESQLHCQAMKTQSEATQSMAEAVAQARAAGGDPSGIPNSEISRMASEQARITNEGADQEAKRALKDAEIKLQDQKRATHEREEAEKLLNERRAESDKWRKQESCDLALLNEATVAAQKAAFQADGARLEKERASEKAMHAARQFAMKQAQAKSRLDEQEAAKRSVVEAMDRVEAATERLAEARRCFGTRDSELQMARVRLDNAGVGAARCRNSEGLQWEDTQRKKLEKLWASDTRAYADAVTEKYRWNCLGYAREEELARADVARSQQLMAQEVVTANTLTRDARQLEQCAIAGAARSQQLMAQEVATANALARQRLYRGACRLVRRRLSE